MSPFPPSKKDKRESAVALRDEGQLEAAAQILDTIGEHREASDLRWERTQCLRENENALAVLREACAQTFDNGPSAQKLRRRLAEQLIQLVRQNQGPDTQQASKQTRSLLMEAAAACRDSGDHEQAGKLYESLGMLSEAARAYQNAGAIESLEKVFQRLEQQEQRERNLKTLVEAVDEAWAEGKRQQAKKWIESLEATAPGLRIPEALKRRLAELKQKEIQVGPDKAFALSLRIKKSGEADGRLLHFIAKNSLTFGRSPDSEIVVDGSGISRQHLRIKSSSANDRTEIVANDLGSKAGSYWDSEALNSEEEMPIEFAGELALGLAPPYWLNPLSDSAFLQLWIECESAPPVIDSSTSKDETSYHLAWLFSPEGGDVYFSDTEKLPLRIIQNGQNPILQSSASARVTLFERQLGLGASVDLLHGDRVLVNAGSDHTYEIQVL